VTYGEETTELFAKDLHTLLADTAEGLELPEGNFVVKYTHKGKEITVKTENNFKVMVSKPPNAEGVFEVRVELKGEAKPEASTPATPTITAPVYDAPSTSDVEPSAAVAHLEDVAMVYYKRLLDEGLLTDGQKQIIDHRGDMVNVTGTLYNGCLVGRGTYTDKNGNRWTAWFNNDLKHGTGLVDQTAGIR